MKRQTFLLGLGLVIITSAVFLQVGGHGFISYDDVPYLLENPGLGAGLTWKSARWALGTFYASNWHPLTWLSHQLDVSLFGFDPRWHHLESYLIHTAAAVLLFLVLRGMTGAPWKSSLVAAFFAVHPLHVESVAWASERKDVLSGLFFMLTMAAYLRYLRRPSPGRFLVAATTFALGLMAKPMLVTLPLVLLLLDFWPLGRFPIPGPGRGGSPRFPAVREKWPLFLLSAASAGVTMAAQISSGSLGTVEDFPLGTRLANALVSYVDYGRQMLWPSGLAVFYPFPAQGIPLWKTCGAAGVLAVLTWGAVRWSRRLPCLAVGWFWYLGMLLPVIGLVQVGYQSRADRYTYLPLIGLFLALVWGAGEVAVSRSGLRPLVSLLGASALGICLILSLAQVPLWRDGVSLFRHALSVTTDNWQSRYNLGLSLYEQGNLAESVAHFSRALALNPGFEQGFNNLGLVLGRLGRSQEGILYLKRAIALNPGYREAWYNLGLAYLSLGDRQGALQAYEKLKGIDGQWAGRLLSMIEYR